MRCALPQNLLFLIVEYCSGWVCFFGKGGGLQRLPLFVCGHWSFCSFISAVSLIHLEPKREMKYCSPGLCSLSLSWGPCWSLIICLQLCLQLSPSPACAKSTDLSEVQGSSQGFLSMHLVMSMHFALCLPRYKWWPFQAFIPSRTSSLAFSFPVFWVYPLLALFLVLGLLVYVLNLLADTQKITVTDLAGGCETNISLCTSPPGDCQTGQNTQLQYFKNKVFVGPWLPIICNKKTDFMSP